MLPWLIGQAYYAEPFVSVSLGFEDKYRFYDRCVPFYDDYRRLGELLPNDAGILVDEDSPTIAAVYAPRPVYMDPADASAGMQLYLFRARKDEVLASMQPPDDGTLGEAIYKSACNRADSSSAVASGGDRPPGGVQDLAQRTGRWLEAGRPGPWHTSEARILAGPRLTRAAYSPHCPRPASSRPPDTCTAARVE